MLTHSSARQHAFNVARCQLFVFGSTDDPDEWPPWLEINPSWAQEIDDFNNQNGTDILTSLWSIGGRMRHNQHRYDNYQIYWPDDDLFWGTEPTAEEGAATENQVSFNVDDVDRPQSLSS